MSCEFCPAGGGGCIVCDPEKRTPTPRGWGSVATPEAQPVETVTAILSEDPPFTATVHAPHCDYLTTREAPEGVSVRWDWWGVEVEGPIAGCLAFLAVEGGAE